MPTKLEENVLVLSQLDPRVFVLSSGFQKVWLGDDTQGAMAFGIDVTTLLQNDLVRIVIPGGHDGHDDGALLANVVVDKTADELYILPCLHLVLGVDETW